MPKARSRQDVIDALPEEWKGLPLLSYSQLMLFDRCSFAWYLAYHMDEHSPVKSRASDVGTYTHDGLQKYYDELKRDLNMSHEEWVMEVIPALMMEWTETMTDTDQYVSMANAQRLLTRYVSRGRAANLGAHTPVETELHFVILMVTPRGRQFLLQGYVDLITIDEKGRTWIWDHKTTSSGKFWTPIQILMDTQLPVYEIGLLQEGIAAHGLVVNQLNGYDYKGDNFAKKSDYDLFRREFTYRTDLELSNIKAEFMAMVDDLLDVRNGETAARRSLKKDCSMCTFNGLCLNLLKGIDHEAATELWRDAKLANRIKPFEEKGEGIILDV